MFKVIIWATDGSSGAERAFPFAKGLAQADGARLVVVHVKEITAGRGGTYPVKVDEDKIQTAIGKQVAEKNSLQYRLLHRPEVQEAEVL
jgi:nucleotide-binding universal stress UspA family protein